MKRSLLIVLMLLIGSAFSVSQAQSAPQVSIAKGAFKVGKYTFTNQAGWPLVSFQDELRGTARERDGYNKTHSYDEQGVVLFEPKKDDAPGGIVTEVQFFFGGHETNNVTAKENFKGTLKLDKLKVTSSNTYTPAQVRKKLKSWEESDSYMDNNYRFEKKGIYVYVQFNKEENKIAKISVGPAKPKK